MIHVRKAAYCLADLRFQPEVHFFRVTPPRYLLCGTIRARTLFTSVHGNTATLNPKRKENTMVRNTRREFLGDVGRGMLLAGLGTTLPGDLGLAYVRGDEAPATRSFGEMTPLLSLIPPTPPPNLHT